MSSEPEALAVAIVERCFALLHDCRAVVPQLEAAPTDPESVTAQTERLLHFAWWARSTQAWSARPRMR